MSKSIPIYVVFRRTKGQLTDAFESIYFDQLRALQVAQGFHKGDESAVVLAYYVSNAFETTSNDFEEAKETNETKLTERPFLYMVTYHDMFMTGYIVKEIFATRRAANKYRDERESLQSIKSSVMMQYSVVEGICNRGFLQPARFHSKSIVPNYDDVDAVRLIRKAVETVGHGDIIEDMTRAQIWPKARMCGHGCRLYFKSTKFKTSITIWWGANPWLIGGGRSVENGHGPYYYTTFQDLKYAIHHGIRHHNQSQDGPTLSKSRRRNEQRRRARDKGKNEQEVEEIEESKEEVEQEVKETKEIKEDNVSSMTRRLRTCCKTKLVDNDTRVNWQRLSNIDRSMSLVELHMDNWFQATQLCACDLVNLKGHCLESYDKPTSQESKGDTKASIPQYRPWRDWQESTQESQSDWQESRQVMDEGTLDPGVSVPIV